MPPISRRDLLASGAALAAASLAPEVGAALRTELPSRPLGRTGVTVPVVGMGTAGLAGMPPETLRQMASRALDLGISLMDTSPSYGETQSALGPWVARHREGLFLASKARATTAKAVIAEVEQSLRDLRTDHLDLVCLQDLSIAADGRPGPWVGALEGLRRARERGLVRLLGVSGHSRPQALRAALRSGELQVLMAPVNYVDDHTYGFSRHLLSEAERLGVGVLAMRVLGGRSGFTADGLGEGRLARVTYTGALRYALSQPSVSCAVLGMADEGQVSQAAFEASRFRPLTSSQMRRAHAEGQRLAQEWGPHLGPIA
ncbi:MAG TPA: aldo/keto reductase [Armatimonadota bacterium]